MPHGRSHARGHHHRGRGDRPAGFSRPTGWTFRPRDFAHRAQWFSGRNKNMTSELPPEAAKILHDVDKRQVDKADDWLAAFSKKSNEALAKKAAEKQVEKPPDERSLVEALARKDHTEYDRMRSDVAETLGIRVGTLDEKVEIIRKKLAGDDAEEELPHWKVEPWQEEVD